MYVNIETRYMVNESRVVDEAEGLAKHTKNEFMREFRRTMDKDEARTLKY